MYNVLVLKKHFIA